MSVSLSKFLCPERHVKEVGLPVNRSTNPPPASLARRVLALIAASTLVLGLASCAEGAKGDDDRPMVLTTFTVLADIAENVAG